MKKVQQVFFLCFFLWYSQYIIFILFFLCSLLQLLLSKQWATNKKTRKTIDDKLHRCNVHVRAFDNGRRVIRINLVSSCGIWPCSIELKKIYKRYWRRFIMNRSQWVVHYDDIICCHDTTWHAWSVRTKTIVSFSPFCRAIVNSFSCWIFLV